MKKTKKIRKFRSLKNFFKGLNKGIKTFSLNVALIVNSVLLTVVYVFGIGLTGIIAKIFGKRFLDIDRVNLKKKGTYWKTLDLRKGTRDEYYRQF